MIETFRNKKAGIGKGRRKKSRKGGKERGWLSHGTLAEVIKWELFQGFLPWPKLQLHKRGPFSPLHPSPREGDIPQR